MKTPLEKKQMPQTKEIFSQSQAQQSTLGPMSHYQAVQAKQLYAIDHSFRQVTQRRQLESSFGQVLQRQVKVPEKLGESVENVFNIHPESIGIHTESTKATNVGALAFTQGSNIHFAPGQYQPETAQGKHLLGHELAHVVQQREGRVRPTGQVAGMPVNDNPTLEKEADVMASKI